MTNLQNIISEIRTSSVNEIEARKINFKMYVKHLDFYAECTDIEKVTIIEGIAKDTTILVQTVKDNWNRLLEAKKFGLDLELYASFNKVKTDNAQVRSKKVRVTKAGKLVQDRKKQSEIADAKTVVQATNDNEILQLLGDESFLKFKKSFEDKGYKLANIMKALKN